MSDNPAENEVEKGIEKLEERHEHLSVALESRKKAKEQIPLIQRDIEQTEWQIRALKARPPESIEIPFGIIGNQLEEENIYIKRSYPVLNATLHSVMSSTSSVTTSGSMGVFEYVNRIKDIGTPEAIDYGNAYITEYNQIQEVQQRHIEVRKLLEKFNSPNILDRFDRAFSAYQAYRSKSGERTAAANEMRNLVMGFQGNLFSIARKWEKEEMKWSKMSARLAINGGGGKEHIFLNNQQSKYSSLITRLSDVSKDRDMGSITNLDSIWTELLDFIFAVMGLVAL